MNELSSIILNKRLEAGLSQSELGNICGMSDSSINRLEKGLTKNPDWQNLCEIAKALHIHPFDIMLAAGYITQEDICPSSKLSGLSDLTDEEITEVQKYINFLHFKKNNGGDK